MRPDEQYNHNASRPAYPPRKLELFFFETVGNRNYLRLTRLAVTLILFLTLIPLLTLLTLFLYNRASTSSEQINVNVRSTANPSATPMKNIIVPAPPPQHPPRVQMQPIPPAAASPVVPHGTDRNMNELPVPDQTPQQPKTKPPT